MFVIINHCKKISAKISMGNKIPVEVFSPKTKANITTMMMPMPLMPDLDNPNKNAAKQNATHCKILS